jgi:hypothetical protein
MRLRNLYGKDYEDWNNSQDDLLINMKQKEMKKEYITCEYCSYDIVDDEGNIMEHYCIND